MKHSPIIFSLFGSDAIAKKIQFSLDYEMGTLNFHSFPDEETLLKIESSVKGREILFIANLDRPNSKIFPLICAAATAREQGAKKVRLIAPYLVYMRQDHAFHPGEGITSKYFAQLISRYFDEVITIDPHLHRWHALSDIYSIPAKVLHATDNIAAWITKNCTQPLLIGPDSESQQWVSEIAHRVHAPFLILEKIRKDDRTVEVRLSNIEQYRDCTPILVDDIISTAMTMIETVKQLNSLKMKSPICIGVHAIFSGHAYEDLLQAGAGKIVTCNTVLHLSNDIDVSNILIAALRSTGE